MQYIQIGLNNIVCKKMTGKAQIKLIITRNEQNKLILTYCNGRITKILIKQVKG